MVITSLGPRIRLFGTALSLACAGPAIAQPVDAECHTLWNLAEMAPHLDQLTQGIGGAREVEALLAFDRALRRMPPALLADAAMSGGHLVSRVPQLVAHVEALHAIRRAAAQGNQSTVRAAAHSPEMRAGEALVQRLLDEQRCRPRGWFAAGAGVAPTQIPGETITDRVAELGDHVGVRALGGANLLAFAVVALTAGALMALPWARTLLRKRPILSRRHPRHGCGRWTTFEHGGKAHKSLIIDASRIGCRIAKPPKVRRGTCVTIDVCGAPVSAKVMWRRKYFAGLRFAAALDEAQLAALHRSEQDSFGPEAAAGNNRRSGAA